MSRDVLSLGGFRAPQDPYLPQVTPKGPSFLDTAACLCALRTISDGAPSDSAAAWHCIGNQTQGVYEVTTGRWYNTIHGGNNVDGDMADDSNGPDTSNPMVFRSGFLTTNEDGVGDGERGLSEYDRACNGRNQSTFSTAFYEAARAIENGQEPISAAPCYRSDRQAVPIRIQDVDSWNTKGCAPGFLCMNNTVNSLPQYCPPQDGCQLARLASMTCMLHGQNIPMGPFEPVVCQQGYYCPPPGTDKIECPKGTYCHPGAVAPTPCLAGSRCEAGSTYELFLVPLVILILVDILLIIGIIIHGLHRRVRDRRADRDTNNNNNNGQFTAASPKGRGMSLVRAQITGYKALHDQTDHEMLPVSESETNTAPYRTDSYGVGFQAALDYDHHQWMSHTAAANAINASASAAAAPPPPKEQTNPQLVKFVESMRRATDATNLGLSFSYTDLCFQPKKSKKMILQNVTGCITRGTLTAVMGGSGAGKSTFVNVLMGKTKNTGGLVAVNNFPDKLKRYKKVIGYVPQDDILLPELTVYENIVHSAKIRLPRTWSTDDIEAHVTCVVDCLELAHVRNSLVGTVGRPTISGGQRKRVSIGMELACAPMAIFLDEPTSGLDATAASSMMLTLKAVARLGITVIVIIHQPRSEIFQLFDNLILLGNGQTIYEGPQAQVHAYFQDIGFHFPKHSNHADVVTDIITGNGRIYKPSGEISKDSLISNWASHHRTSNSSSSSSRSSSSTKEHRSILSMMSNNNNNNSGMHWAIKHRGAPFLKQLWLCLRRAMVQQYRTKSAFWSEMGLAAIAGFLLGLAEHSKKGILFVGTFKEYAILSTAIDVKSAPELALLIAIAIGLVSGAPGVRSFSEELLVHRRETEAGHNRLAYFLAKLVSVVPRMFFGCLHFSTFVLLLTVPVINWGLAFLANFLYFYCIYGLANITSMVIRREDAPLVATMISLIVAILSGAAPPLAKAKEWQLEWLWRASPGVWLAEIYFGQLVSPFADLFDVEKAAAGTGFHLHWLWRNMGTLLAIGTIYRILAFIGLWALGHRRRS